MNNDKRILIAEDDPVTRELLAEVVSTWGYAPIAVADGRTALNVLIAADAPQLAILDGVMPHISGFEICRFLRSKQRAVYTYLLMLTTQKGTDACIEGLSAGADDYLTKPYDREELRLRLATGQRVIAIQDRLASAHDELQKRLDCDHLTGLASRAALTEALDHECARAGRLGGSCGVIMLDLDRFKQINDLHGHQVGDAALTHVGQVMQDHTRQYDTCGRYGGDEFTIILPNATTEHAALVADRICQAVASTPLQIDDGEISITLSVGVAVSKASSTSGTEIVRLADEALYKAKRLGRNQVAVAMSAAAN